MAALVAISGCVDVNRFFNIQMRDASVFAEYSTGSTLVARAANKLDPATKVYVDDRLTAEPPIEFLAPQLKDAPPFRSTVLPFVDDSAEAVYVAPDLSADVDTLRKFYPTAQVTSYSNPYGGPVLLYGAVVSKADAESAHGVQATYQPATGQAVSGRVSLLGTKPSGAPTGAVTADWKAVLDAPVYGDYGFKVEGSTSLQLLVDEQSVTTDGQAVQVSLARGTHDVELKGALAGSEQVSLTWRPPSSDGLVPVPASVLFGPPVVNNGLLGQYYANGNWTSPAAFEQIDSAISFYYQQAPFPLPFSIEWSGQLAAPVTGVYTLNTTSIDSSQITLDGKLIFNGTAAPTPVTLNAGLHNIRVRFEAHSGHNHVELNWTPPGRPNQIVPSAYLFPDSAVGQAQPLPVLPAAPTPAAPSANPGVAGQPATDLAAVWVVNTADAVGAKSVPVGAATDSAGNIYVADAGRRSVEKFGPDGKLLWEAASPAGKPGFQALAAIVVAPDGSALVMDSEGGYVSRFSADGHFVATIAGGNLPVYHPRGLAAGPQGDLYLADTGGSRVLHLDPNGNQLGSIGSHGTNKGELDQPTGAALAANGDLFVLDPAAKKVVDYAPSGGALREWPAATGPTVNGPQATIGPDGSVWTTDTQQNRLMRIDPASGKVSAYSAGVLSGPSGIAAGKGFVVVAQPSSASIVKLAVDG